MVEAILFLLDLLLITYACWVVFRGSKKRALQASDFGILAYKTKPGEDHT